MTEPTPVEVITTNPIPVRVVGQDLYNYQERRQSSIPPVGNNIQYLVAVVLMMLIGVAGVVAVEVLRIGHDNVALDASILGFLAPTTLSLLAFMKSQETHLSVNSRLDAFIANAKLAAMAQGVKQGRQEGRDAANARTDELRRNESER